MELRADLEDRHRFQNTNREPDHVTQDIAEAMHLSLDFLQSITDLDGDLKRLVLPCLDLASRIMYEMDTSKLGDPEAVSTIKRLRRFQSIRMHHFVSDGGTSFRRQANLTNTPPLNSCLTLWNILKIPPGRHGLKQEALCPLTKKNSDTVFMTLS